MKRKAFAAKYMGQIVFSPLRLLRMHDFPDGENKVTIKTWEPQAEWVVGWVVGERVLQNGYTVRGDFDSNDSWIGTAGVRVALLAELPHRKPIPVPMGGLELCNLDPVALHKHTGGWTEKQRTQLSSVMKRIPRRPDGTWMTTVYCDRCKQFVVKGTEHACDTIEKET